MLGSDSPEAMGQWCSWRLRVHRAGPRSLSPSSPHPRHLRARQRQCCCLPPVDLAARVGTFGSMGWWQRPGVCSLWCMVVATASDTVHSMATERTRATPRSVAFSQDQFTSGPPKPGVEGQHRRTPPHGSAFHCWPGREGLGRGSPAPRAALGSALVSRFSTVRKSRAHSLICQMYTERQRPRASGRACQVAPSSSISAGLGSWEVK